MWLAKGACRTCTAPIAKRRAIPGFARARCNQCGRVTRMFAWRARGRTAWTHVALVCALLVAGAAGVSAGARQSAKEPWGSLEQRLVPSLGTAGLTFHVETTATDMAGNPIPAESLDALPLWHYAAAVTLAPPEALVWSRCDAPPACPFGTSTSAVVHFSPVDPRGGIANAYDARDGSVWFHVGGAWSRFDDPEEGLKVRFRAAS